MTIHHRSRIPRLLCCVKSPVQSKSFSRSTDRNPQETMRKHLDPARKAPQSSQICTKATKKEKVQSCPCHWTGCGLPNNRELLQLGESSTQAMALTLLQGAVYITWSKSEGHQQADCSRSLVHIHCCRCLLPVLLVQRFIEIFDIYCVCALARDSPKSGIFF